MTGPDMAGGCRVVSTRRAMPTCGRYVQFPDQNQTRAKQPLAMPSRLRKAFVRKTIRDRVHMVELVFQREGGSRVGPGFCAPYEIFHAFQSAPGPRRTTYAYPGWARHGSLFSPEMAGLACGHVLAAPKQRKAPLIGGSKRARSSLGRVPKLPYPGRKVSVHSNTTVVRF
jgi:hypothetical protein